jgi:hypothetical protein
MRIRFRLGPFTFGSGGTRLSPWRRGTGFSIPLFRRNATSYGKIKFGIFSFLFNNKSERLKAEKDISNYQQVIKNVHNQAYEPWSKEADEKLTVLFSQGKTVNELSEIFGRTKGAIRSRIKRLMLD